MQHKRTLSEYKDQTGDGNFIYGYDSQPEDDDSPIMIRSGVSVPVWKTPSTLQDQPKEPRPRFSDATADSGIPENVADTLSDFSDLEELGETDPPVDPVRAHAAIISEKPVKLSIWKRFTGFVSRYAPDFADESAILRFNLYLGGAAFLLAVVILVVVLATSPAL